MSSNENTVDHVKVLLRQIHNNTSIPIDETLCDLEQIQEELDALIEACKGDIARDEGSNDD